MGARDAQQPSIYKGVMVSSTFEDLKEHREALADALEKQELHPVWMEKVIPSADDDVISSSLKMVRKASAYIGLISHRYGGVPEDDKRNPKGHSVTRMEFEEAQKLKRPTLIFVMGPDHDVKARDVESDPDRKKKLETFRARAKDGRIYVEFNSLEEFAREVVHHVAKVKEFLRELESRTNTNEADDPVLGEGPDRKDQPLAVSSQYRDWLIGRYGLIEMEGFDRRAAGNVQLSSVYVPLTVAGGGPGGPEDDPDATEAWADSERWRHDQVQKRKQRQRSLLLNHLAKDSLAVSGAPGSGKSTYCKWVAIRAAGGPGLAQQVNTPDGYEEEWPEELSGRLPILVELRDFWADLPSTRANLSRAQLERTLRRWIEDKAPQGLQWSNVKGHLRQGSALLILDGFDEVPTRMTDGDRVWNPKELLISGLSEAVPFWQKKNNRIMVTSRPYGWSVAQVSRMKLSNVAISELPSELQQQLVHCWFYVLESSGELRGEEDKAQSLARRMMEEVRERERLDELTANPLFLTAMCIVFSEGKRLPKDKLELYRRLIDRVLHNRVAGYIEPVQKRLAAISLGMHTGQGLDSGYQEPRAEITSDELDQLLEHYGTGKRTTDKGFESVHKARQELLSNSGLLLPRGDEAGESGAQFYHLSIQEYLAAQRIFALRSQKFLEIFEQRCGTPAWSNTLSFLFAQILSQPSDEGEELLTCLIDSFGGTDIGAMTVISDCQEILASQGSALDDTLTGQLRDKLLEAVECGEGPPEQRLRIGLALGRIGDPRVVDDLRDHDSELAWVRVPAGVYRVGEGESVHDLVLKEDLMLSRYPVTNRQFKAFVEDGGYEKREFWRDEEDKEDEGLKWLDRITSGGGQPGGSSAAPKSRFGGGTQPVVDVTYWEAQAFARWVGGRLPSEWEWEAAARGKDSVYYPWGGKEDWEDGICNSREARLGQTSPVGLFPRSRSRCFEFEDMAGNVWEWCASPWRDSYRAKSDWHLRVVRGGAWYNVSGNLRCSFRNGFHPNFRYDFLGFRMVFPARTL